MKPETHARLKALDNLADFAHQSDLPLRTLMRARHNEAHNLHALMESAVEKALDKYKGPKLVKRAKT